MKFLSFSFLVLFFVTCPRNSNVPIIFCPFEFPCNHEEIRLVARLPSNALFRFSPGMKILRV